jgi:selenocysteine-specific elongation factor
MLIHSQDALEFDEVFVSKASFEKLQTSILTSLERLHNADRVASAISLEKLRSSALRFVRSQIEAAVISSLIENRKVIVAGDGISLSGRGSQLSDTEQKALASLRQTFAKAGLEVPKSDDVIKTAADTFGIDIDTARKLFQQLLDSGEIVRISPEFSFLTPAIASLIEKMRTHAATIPDRTIDVPTFKDIAGVSRKYAIPLLEYFDQQKITARRGDKRLVL